MNTSRKTFVIRQLPKQCSCYLCAIILMSNNSHKLFNFLLSREKQRLKSGVSETGKFSKWVVYFSCSGKTFEMVLKISTYKIERNNRLPLKSGTGRAPMENFRPPGKMCWRYFKTIGHCLKIWSLSKNSSTPWCLKLVTGLLTIHFVERGRAISDSRSFLDDTMLLFIWKANNIILSAIFQTYFCVSTKFRPVSLHFPFPIWSWNPKLQIMIGCTWSTNIFASLDGSLSLK